MFNLSRQVIYVLILLTDYNCTFSEASCGFTIKVYSRIALHGIIAMQLHQ